MNIAILGRTKMLMNTISLLEKTEHKIVLIGTCRAMEEYGIDESAYEQKAKEVQAAYFNSPNINREDIKQLIRSTKADLAISVNWINIIGKEVIDLFTYGVLNAHCGDLPRYRGNACPNWAIINGENHIGICIHQMESEQLDSGNIIERQIYPLTDSTTITEIYEYLENKVPELFLRAIEKVVKGFSGITQSKKKEDILRAYPRVPSDSWINWERTCEEIGRLIRASGFPFSGAYSFLNGQCISIFEYELEEFECQSCYVAGQVVWIDKKTNKAGVAAKDGIIVIKKIKLDGKEASVSDVIHSTRMRFNFHVQDKLFELEKRVNELERRLNLHT